MRHLRMALIVCALVVALAGLASCSSDGGESHDVPAAPTYDLHLEVAYEENILFAIYDVDVCVDDEKLGSVSQGNTFKEICPVEEGAHTVSFVKSGEREAFSEVDLTVEAESYYSCTIKAHESWLDVKDQRFETAEEHNAREMSEQEEREKEEAAKKAEAEKQAEEEKAQAEQEEATAAETEALEKAFPRETALKAVTVALTNATAPDVFGSDGNSHDVSKYHSYSDRSGDYLELVSDGEWTRVDEKTWHVEGLEYENSYGVHMDASADVTFDGKNYVVSNLGGMLGEPDIGTPLEQYEQYYDDSWCYLTVTPDLLK